jgi:hypothetical protein
MVDQELMFPLLHLITHHLQGLKEEISEIEVVGWFLVVVIP